MKNKLVNQLIQVLGLNYSKGWINPILIFKTTGSIEKHNSVFIILSQKNSEQP